MMNVGAPVYGKRRSPAFKDILICEPAAQSDRIAGESHHFREET